MISIRDIFPSRERKRIKVAIMKHLTRISILNIEKETYYKYRKNVKAIRCGIEIDKEMMIIKELKKIL